MLLPELFCLVSLPASMLGSLGSQSRAFSPLFLPFPRLPRALSVLLACPGDSWGRANPGCAEPGEAIEWDTPPLCGQPPSPHHGRDAGPQYSWQKLVEEDVLTLATVKATVLERVQVPWPDHAYHVKPSWSGSSQSLSAVVPELPLPTPSCKDIDCLPVPPGPSTPATQPPPPKRDLRTRVVTQYILGPASF